MPPPTHIEGLDPRFFRPCVFPILRALNYGVRPTVNNGVGPERPNATDLCVSFSLFDGRGTHLGTTGVIHDTSLVMPTAVNKSVDYELTYLHKKRKTRTRAGKYKMAKHVFKAATKAAAVAASPLSFARTKLSVNAPEAVVVAPPAYGIANVSDMRLAGADMAASSYTEATQKYEALIARRPELAQQVQILAHHELNVD